MPQKIVTWKLPRWLIIILGIMGVLLFFWTYDIAGEKLFLLPSSVEQMAVSPDGRYRAILVDGSTGAWDDWDEVYLERDGMSLGTVNPTRQFAAGDSDIATLAWSGPRVLVIRYSSDWGRGKPDARWRDVRIVHRVDVASDDTPDIPGVAYKRSVYRVLRPGLRKRTP